LIGAFSESNRLARLINDLPGEQILAPLFSNPDG